ncbi:2-phosphosulfolactate phosphatase [Thermogemmatispora onikobensis]|uniref:2-phosphosulfolactate phosphatase n=1 Tax=Thermogemmatispora onikobensis TaxID=732234 RepID=UPI00159F0B58|nr:2-phosphosulfolactate phosphatase [Thermogemmatispora onikobensis]
MRLFVFFTPQAILTERAQTGDVYIVIDLIRATTTMTVMLERGARRVLVAESIEQAQAGAAYRPGRALCGERNVRRIPGFDYGNSPREFAQLDLQGRELIMTTTNGTRAFHACPPETIRLAGCFRNAHAVTSAALRLASAHDRDIALVCAGEFGYFALDDAVCAGYLAAELLRQAGHALTPHGSVLAATAIYEAYKPPRVLECSESALTVVKAGVIDDPPFCVEIDQSTVVPAVSGREEETGLLIIEPLPL